MAVNYEVLDVAFKGDWEGQYGPMKTWTLKLRQQDSGDVFTAERNTKPNTKIEVGETLYGTIQETQYGKRLKVEQQQSFGGGGDKFERRPENPSNTARMKHTSAMSAAPDYYRLMREENVIPKPDSKDAMVQTLTGVIAWLEGTYPREES